MINDQLITNAIRSAIGRESEPVATTVTNEKIKIYAQAIQDTNPLWNNARQARRAGFSGLVAPPVFLVTLKDPDWVKRNQTLIDCPLKGVLAGSDEFEFYETIYAGDIIYTTHKLANATIKDGKSGKMVFLQAEITFRNQFGDLVAKNFNTVIRKEILPASNNTIGEMATPPRSSLPSAEIVNFNFDGVYEGMEIPYLVKNVTTRQLVVYAGITKQLNELHYDKDFAQRMGYRTVICHGVLVMSFLAQMISDWVGKNGTISHLSASYRGVHYAGEDVICKGKVLNKFENAGIKSIEFQIWTENSRGEKIIPGNALITLKSDK